MGNDYILYFGFSFRRDAAFECLETIRKCFLTAVFPPDFIKDLVDEINLENSLDEELVKEIDNLYGIRGSNIDSVVSYIRNFVNGLGKKITLSELEEFRLYHGIDDSIFKRIIFGYITSNYNTPQKIKAYLDTQAVGQESAKKTLSVSFFIHLIRIGIIKDKGDRILRNLNSFPKPNVLIVGTTGSGKSYMINLLCNLFGIPFIKIDCSSLVSSGYVGNNINTYFRSLLSRYGKEGAERAIIFFDEFDKISENNLGRTGSVGGVELQQEFLTILEDRHITVRVDKGMENDPIQMNSEKMMMVFAGSFAGIEDLIAKRVDSGRGSLGFKKGDNIEHHNILKKLNFEDLINFGIIPELVGRIGFIAVLNTLSKQELIFIIKNTKNNELKKYENFFAFNGDKIHFHDKVYGLIAEEAIKRKTGARGVTSVILQLLNDLLYESVNDITESFEITEEYFKSKM